MRIIDRARGSRASRLARYVQIERKEGPGPLGVLRRNGSDASRARLARFLGIDRVRTDQARTSLS